MRPIHYRRQRNRWSAVSERDSYRFELGEEGSKVVRPRLSVPSAIGNATGGFVASIFKPYLYWKRKRERERGTRVSYYI